MRLIENFRFSSVISIVKISNCRRFSSLFLTLKHCDIPDLISLLSIFIFCWQISARSAASFEYSPEREIPLTNRLRTFLVLKLPSCIANEICSCKSCDGSCYHAFVFLSTIHFLSHFSTSRFGIQRHLPFLLGFYLLHYFQSWDDCFHFVDLEYISHNHRIARTESK